MNPEPTIIYEDNDIAVINKPAGLVVHPDGRTDEPTLCDWLVAKWPSIVGVGEPLVLNDGRTIDRPGIVHRLDRETSGAMVIAKTQEAHAHLKAQFQAHTINKTYHAFVHGHVRATKGVIDRPIGRSASDFRRWSAQRGAKGDLREAVTRYETLAKVVDDFGDLRLPASLVAAHPVTGRTHQIRVHFKAIDHPLAGDSLYGANKKKLLGFDRLALHSRELSLALMDGSPLTVKAPYPADFRAALEAFPETKELLAQAE
jgi:23S rRNA pseudouridine1911/1915/1917 synthase